MPFHAFIRNRLDELRSEDRYRVLPDTGKRNGKYITVEGQPLLNLSSNDYLGLGDDSVLRAAFTAAFLEHGYLMTSSSSRLLTGNHYLYEQLERELAHLYDREAALVFNSGYHANTGILPALTCRHDLILSDKLNHASIIDGSRISEAAYRRYRHNDPEHLEELLEDAVGKYRQVFIVTESVFSMDGDLADLPKLAALKKKYGAVLIVDEAHGAGVFGERGLGLSESAGTVGEIDIIVGTFGKAFASTGAYAVMNELIRDYLVNTMRPFIVTTALPPAVLAWSLLTLHRQAAMQVDRSRLLHLASIFRSALVDKGFDVPGESHIVPVITGTNQRALGIAATLREAGVLGMAVRPPTVPENRARIRFSLRASLEWADIEHIPDLISGVLS